MTEQIARPKVLSRTLSADEQQYYGSIIEQLKDTRKKKGVSQATLDEIIGVSEGMVAKWESKARLPGAFFLMCWCLSLDIKIKLIRK